MSATTTATEQAPAPAAPRKQTLIDIGQDMAAFSQLLDEVLDASGGELTSDLEQIIDDWLAENGKALAKKADGYAAIIRERQLVAAARKEEAERLHKLAKVDENLADRLKLRLKLFMEATGQKKIETARYKIGVQANGGKVGIELALPPDGAASLPEPFRKASYSANEEVIRGALEAGEELSFAKLKARGTHLSIK